MQFGDACDPISVVEVAAEEENVLRRDRVRTGPADKPCAGDTPAGAMPKTTRD